MSAISPYTTASPGGFYSSPSSSGIPTATGFGFPSFGDPLFYQAPMGASGLLNRDLAMANGSAVNVDFGPLPSTLGFGGLLLGNSFFGGSGNPGGSSPFSAGGPFANGALGSLGNSLQSGQAQSQGSQASPSGGVDPSSLAGAGGAGSPAAFGGYPSLSGQDAAGLGTDVPQQSAVPDSSNALGGLGSLGQYAPPPQPSQNSGNSMMGFMMMLILMLVLSKKNQSNSQSTQN